MNVYVETNFVLELSLLQEEHESCERIIALCESGGAKLILPAYSLAEPNETLKKSSLKRGQLADTVKDELKYLTRSASYKDETKTLEAVVDLFARSAIEERQRFTNTRQRLLQAAEIIPLDSTILISAVACEQQYRLSPQDALVFASVLQNLNIATSPSCFIDRDKHFANSDIE